MQQAGAEATRPSSADTTYRTLVAGNINFEKTLDYFVVCPSSFKEVLVTGGVRNRHEGLQNAES